jgi:hypothetical protein
MFTRLASETMNLSPAPTLGRRLPAANSLTFGATSPTPANATIPTFLIPTSFFFFYTDRSNSFTVFGINIFFSSPPFDLF